MAETRPALSPRAIGRLHTSLWLLCVLSYSGVFGSGYLSGGSDLFSMGKAMAATVAIACVGRFVLTMLENARVPVPVVKEDREMGSLLDLVSSPSDLLADEVPATPGAREPVAVGAR